MPPFSKDRLNHDNNVTIQLVSGSGEAQGFQFVNYVFGTATSKIQSGREWASKFARRRSDCILRVLPF